MEYEEELFEEGWGDTGDITNQGLFDEQESQAKKEAVRKHLARSRLVYVACLQIIASSLSHNIKVRSTSQLLCLNMFARF